MLHSGCSGVKVFLGTIVSHDHNVGAHFRRRVYGVFSSGLHLVDFSKMSL